MTFDTWKSTEPEPWQDWPPYEDDYAEYCERLEQLKAELLAALHEIAAGLADTGSDRKIRMTLMTKQEAWLVARNAIVKAAEM